MPVITVKEASAASVIGTNLMSGNRIQTAASFRKVNRIGVVGSAVPGDASVDLFYGSEYIGTFFNTTGGANLIPTSNVDMIEIPDEKFTEPGEPINLLISDVGATNVLAVTLEIDEVQGR